MSEFAHLIAQFGKIAKFTEDRFNVYTEYSYVDGLLRYALGGNEVRELVEFVKRNPSYRLEVLNNIRDLCATLYNESGIINHAVSKPRGYPGDFEIMENVYDCSPHYKTVSELGLALDRWALSLNLPRAVRARKNGLLFLINDLVSNSGRNEFSILSIGSGSARELRELPVDVLEKTKITLIDRDADALVFAKEELFKKSSKVKIDLIAGDFHRFSSECKYDLIYSFGVFDYLSDKVIKNCFKQFTPYLIESGKLVYSIKNSAQYNDWFYDLFTHWRFVARSIEDGAKLLAESDLKLSRVFPLESDVAAIYVTSKEK